MLSEGNDPKTTSKIQKELQMQIAIKKGKNQVPEVFSVI